MRVRARDRVPARDGESRQASPWRVDGCHAVRQRVRAGADAEGREAVELRRYGVAHDLRANRPVSWYAIELVRTATI